MVEMNNFNEMSETETDGELDIEVPSEATSINNSDPDRGGTPLLNVISENDDLTESLGVESNIENSIENVPQKRFAQIKYLTSITKWWRSYVDDKVKKRKNVEYAEEQRMRYKLKYHFMSPYQKYRMGRKPWKLAVQILKIFIVTTQVVLFGTDRFAAVAFIKNTEKSFKNLFIRGYDGSDSFSYYSRTDLVNAIKYSHTQYVNISNIAVGKFWHSVFKNGTYYPIELCETLHNNKSDWSEDDNEDYNAKDTSVCWILTDNTDLRRILDSKHYFDSVITILMRFELRAMYLNGLKLHHTPECLLMQNKILIDNSKHDGRLRVSFHMVQEILKACVHDYQISKDAKLVKVVFIAFDGLVIFICLFSMILCIRSVIKSIILAKAAQRYFEVYKKEKLSKWDLFELVNKWFAVIVMSDLLSIVGSIYKIYVDDRDIRYYNICSLFLGLGVIMVWIGLLRFLTYLRKYNILLITLRSAAPSLLRFMFCAMFIFFGFTFCGWLVLGPYHKKFATFLRTAECLFSLLNGDDMYPTFGSMSQRSVVIWIFSKIYLYTFVSLFIYVVLSTFISIVGDTYERLRDWGRMPPTKIEKFMAGKRKKKVQRSADVESYCQRCLRQNQFDSSFASEPQFAASPHFEDSYDSEGSILSDDDLSIVSASLE